jgi:ribosome-binding protein aMBF1 (putative translation factor)
MSDLKKYIKRQLVDPDFNEAYKNSEPEYEVMQAIIKARMKSHLSQKELAKKSGIRQSNLSRIESGASLPNISTLEAIAKGLGKSLHIEFR